VSRVRVLSGRSESKEHVLLGRPESKEHVSSEKLVSREPALWARWAFKLVEWSAKGLGKSKTLEQTGR
jgi:hypothetical protein